MAIVKMKFVAANTDKENLNQMLLATVKSGLFHPEPAINIVSEENGGVLISDENVYAEYLSNLKSLGHSLGVNLKAKEVSDKEYTNQEITDFIKELEQQADLANVKDTSYFTNDDNIALNKLAWYDFEKLHGCLFVQFGFGRLPIESYKKLSMYSNEPFVVTKIHESNQYYWVLYATGSGSYSKINTLFDSLFLEKISIPNIDVKKVVENYADKLLDIYTYCNINEELHRLHQYVLIMDEKHVICGFVPERKVEEFKNNFKDMPVDFRVKDACCNTKCTPPTLLKNNAFFKPFELFVEMYSLPVYHEMDPTAFLGITYCLLFGIMFGDLGQGLVITILGYYLFKKTGNRLAAIVSRIGISSMIFGFLFGSVFGLEHLLNPIHQSLFGVHEKLIDVMAGASTMMLLISSVAIGATLILITMLFNVYNKLNNKEYGEALFSNNGLAGFIFYSFIVTAIVLKFNFEKGILTIGYMIPFIYLPLLLFFFKEPLSKFIEKEKVKPHAGWGNFVLETVFEVLEIILSFVTNSLSYLRVGGFILSHAGMMLVVLTLVEMTGKAGPIVLVIGNIFVMGLEGLIVGIQTLRLEYYEIFSRYYKGGGKKYEVITYVD